MKHIFNILSAAVVIVWANSCNLDEFPQSQLSPENTFRTETELQYYLNGLYASMSSYVKGGVLEIADNGVLPTLPTYLTGQRSPSRDAGDWDWSDLRKVNIFLKYSVNCKDEAARRKYEAVAKCIRANFYYDKLKTFGGVPWYDKVLESDDLELYKARDSRDKIATHILEDLDEAIKYGPAERKLNEVTKWTALALKSRFCLFEGTFRKYHGLENADFFLGECVKASTELIASDKYRIDRGNGISTAYRDLFAQPETGDASMTEVILARSYSTALGVKHDINYRINNISGSQYGLDKAFIDTYLMKDGSRFTDIPGYGKKTIVEECIDRDPRLAQTIRTPNFVRAGESSTKLSNMQSAIKVASTGYMPIKYVQSSAHDAQTQNDNDLIAFRYAEVLLNYAEAKAELGTLTQQDLNISIKLIRDRVGMPNLDMAAANADPDEVLAAMYPLVDGANKGVILEIRRERRVELVMEGLRYDDLMRYKAGALMTARNRGIYVPEVSGVIGYSLTDMSDASWSPASGNFFFFTSGNIPPQENNSMEVGTSVFLMDESGNLGNIGNKVISSHINKVWNEDRDYLAPIPVEQLKINPELKQNPLWN
ncbi:MAG: RagB/SusD family nutrient uptake outer membrane protein [Bacteroidales bacterium]|nr:RagB/SusD family nutrient uptake outer membrane protein [Bacteroidales bacterium]